MFPNLLKNQSVNGTSKCFTFGVGVGNFHRFWSQRVLNDLPLTVKKVVNHLE